MLVYIYKERITEAVDEIHRQAEEARKQGDYNTFFELSNKALDLVNGWIARQKKESDLKKVNIKANFKDEKQSEIYFGELGLSIARINAGFGKEKKHLKIV